MTDPRTRHTRGLIVVIILGVLFLTLVALIVFRSGKHAPAAPAAHAENVTVLPLRIRIRTAPTAQAPVVATATSGEQLTMLDDQGAWVRVQTSDGLTGWAERVNLERTAERERRLARFESIRRLPALAGVTTARVTLFAGPGIFYPLVGEIPAGTGVKVFTRDHDFYAVDYNGSIAYADVDHVDVTASGAPQLDVQTASTPASTTETATTETTASIEPPPAEVPQAPSAPELVDRTGVYAAVPPDGTQPEEIDRVIPRYPATARTAGVSGPVVIRGIVRKDGTIDEVEIIKDLPYGLGDAARDAVRKWRFRPATYRGEPIDVYYTVTVNFRLR